MEATTQADIIDHARESYPHEACGLITVVRGKERYVRCRNIATSPLQQFTIDPMDHFDAEEQGEVMMVVHSHPNGTSKLSMADKVQCAAGEIPWCVVGIGEDGACEMTVHEPEGYEAPLIGRPYVHGVLDCYALIRDYYRTNMGIALPEFGERQDGWWRTGQSLYTDNLEANGFSTVKGQPQVGDMILMQIRAKTPNHGAVYIGESMILHHVERRLSSRDLYSQYWQECTVSIQRHKDAR